MARRLLGFDEGSHHRAHVALAVADLGDVGPGLVEVDVVVGCFVGRRELVEVLERLAHRGGTARTGEPRRERLAGVALAGELPDDPHDGFRRALGGQLGRLLAELDLHVADVPAELHVVAGCGAPVGATLDPEEADVGDVVLAARVRAARDVDAHAADLGEPGVLERLADVGGEPATA